MSQSSIPCNVWRVSLLVNDRLEEYTVITSSDSIDKALEIARGEVDSKNILVRKVEFIGSAVIGEGFKDLGNRVIEAKGNPVDGWD